MDCGLWCTIICVAKSTSVMDEKRGGSRCDGEKGHYGGRSYLFNQYKKIDANMRQPGVCRNKKVNLHVLDFSIDFHASSRSQRSIDLHPRFSHKQTLHSITSTASASLAFQASAFQTMSEPIDVSVAQDGGIMKTIIEPAPEGALGPPPNGTEVIAHYTGEYLLCLMH